MTKEQFAAEKRYQSVMAVARKMLRNGLITEKEYRQFDTKMTEKYKLLFGTLFAEIT